MSSSDFSKVKVLDDVLATTDSVKYAVVKGAQNITPSVNNAISKSNSSITFNIQTPSEATVLSRRMMIQTKICFRVTGTRLAQGPLLEIGADSALGPFPFQSLCNTIQMTINNNTVTQNQRDVMFALQRFGDVRETYRYNTSTPVAYDQYWNYADAYLANNNPNGAWNNVAQDPSYQPRGAFKLASVTGNVDASAGVVGNVDFVVEVTEPLMLSPLIWCDPQSNNQGFYGIQVLNLVFNIGTTNRLFRTAGLNIDPAQALTVELGFPGGESNGNAFLDTRLLIQYYTRQPSDLVPARNVVPYAEYPRYITNVTGTIPAATGGANTGLAITPGAFPTIESNSISLNQIPDKIIIFVRKRLANQTPRDADCFFPSSVSVSILITRPVSSPLLLAGTCGECPWSLALTRLGRSLAVLLLSILLATPAVSRKSPPAVLFLPYLWVGTSSSTTSLPLGQSDSSNCSSALRLRTSLRTLTLTTPNSC